MGLVKLVALLFLVASIESLAQIKDHPVVTSSSWKDVGLQDAKAYLSQGSDYFRYASAPKSHFNLTLLRTPESLWTTEILKGHLATTAKIYFESCGVGIGKVTLIEAGFPEPVKEGVTWHPDAKIVTGLNLMVNFKKMLPPRDGPLLVLIDKKMEVNQYGYAFLETGEALIFLSFFGEKKVIDKSVTFTTMYTDIFAHELGHVLIDGHYPPVRWLGHGPSDNPKGEGNIMYSQTGPAYKLNAEQCGRIQTSPLVR